MSLFHLSYLAEESVGNGLMTNTHCITPIVYDFMTQQQQSPARALLSKTCTLLSRSSGRDKVPPSLPSDLQAPPIRLSVPQLAPPLASHPKKTPKNHLINAHSPQGLPLRPWRRIPQTNPIVNTKTPDLAQTLETVEFESAV